MSITKITDPSAVPAAVADYTAQNTHLDRLLGNVVAPYPVSGSNVLKGSLFNIGGDMFYCGADTAITGGVTDYVKLVVTGTDAAPSFVASLAGVTWSQAYNGYYLGSDLYLFSGSTPHSALARGQNNIVLTNYTSTGVPAIAVNSVCEINGALYTNLIEVAITGTTANTTWYDILLTPSGTTFTASFIARGTGTWSDSKQGLYSGNNRVVACAYRDSSSTDWINKNVLEVVNRCCEIKMEIGDWNMDADNKIVYVGTPFRKIRSLFVTIRDDMDTYSYDLHQMDETATYTPGGGIKRMYDTDNKISLVRTLSGNFDNTDFDSTSYNRGWITIIYEV